MRRDRQLTLTGVLLLFFLPAPCAAQEGTVHDAGAWFMFAGQGDLEKVNAKLGKVRWWFDAQIRFLDDSSGFDQGLLRPGLGYAVTESTSIWLGYAWVRTSPGRTADFDEHRIWQQLFWSGPIEWIERATFSSRTRLEQRFLETGDDIGWRFRQYFKLGYPLSFNPRLSLVGYDEVFFDLNDTDFGARSGFAQNRLFVGCGWTCDSASHVTVELGYLNQFIRNRGTRDSMNHILSVNLLLNY